MTMFLTIVLLFCFLFIGYLVSECKNLEAKLKKERIEKELTVSNGNGIEDTARINVCSINSKLNEK